MRATATSSSGHPLTLVQHGCTSFATVLHYRVHMATPQFERARSRKAKQVREEAILRSARTQALDRGVREVTLTDVAAGVGMHKSTMLRYFETREEIFLRLAKSEWADWAGQVTAELDAIDCAGAARDERVAVVLASSLVERPLFCDLLAHVPLNLERGVSMAVAKDFKIAAIDAAGTVAAALRRIVGVSSEQAWDTVAAATSMAGAMWQMAAPGTQLRELYETDPELAHAVVDVGPRLTAILRALFRGYANG